MTISAAQNHQRPSNPLATLLSTPPQASLRKPDHDSDDTSAAKPTQAAKPQLATSGPGQFLNRKV